MYFDNFELDYFRLAFIYIYIYKKWQVNEGGTMFNKKKDVGRSPLNSEIPARLIKNGVPSPGNTSFLIYTLLLQMMDPQIVGKTRLDFDLK